VLAGIGEGEDHHDKGYRPLGFQVSIVNPEPVIAIRDGHERILRLAV
jgi:hypothetical protein